MTFQLPPFPAANVPSAQQKWARAVEKDVTLLSKEAAEIRSAIDSINSGRKGSTGRLQQQVQDLQKQADALQKQAGTLAQQSNDLASQADYLASLVTVSKQGNDYLVNNIPGDQTNRWSNGDNSTLITVRAPTGRLLVGWGAASVECRAGNSTMYGMIRVQLSSPSGWVVTLGSATRMFVTAGVILGVPFASERTFEDVPTNEVISIRPQFGTWSAASGPLAAASFLTPFIRAQVVPA